MFHQLQVTENWLYNMIGKIEVLDRILDAVMENNRGTQPQSDREGISTHGTVTIFMRLDCPGHSSFWP